VLVGSLSHLGTQGVSNCTEKIVRVVSSLGSRVGHGVDPVPLVPVPVGGFGGRGWVGDAFDLDSLITGFGLSPGSVLQKSRTIFWDLCARNGSQERTSKNHSSSHAACAIPVKTNFF
jgi:hypothetical protein